MLKLVDNLLAIYKYSQVVEFFTKIRIITPHIKLYSSVHFP